MEQETHRSAAPTRAAIPVGARKASAPAPIPCRGVLPQLCQAAPPRPAPPALLGAGTVARTDLGARPRRARLWVGGIAQARRPPGSAAGSGGCARAGGRPLPRPRRVRRAGGRAGGGAMFVARSIAADHRDLIHDVSFDFHGRRMATCSSDQSVKVSGSRRALCWGGDGREGSGRAGGRCRGLPGGRGAAAAAFSLPRSPVTLLVRTCVKTPLLSRPAAVATGGAAGFAGSAENPCLAKGRRRRSTGKCKQAKG